MALPLLDFVTGRARQALPFLRSAALQGLSPSAALSSLRQLGGGGQTQRLLDIYSVFQSRATPERIARLVGANQPFAVDLHTVAPTDISSNYQYVVRTNITTNQQEDFLTVASDVPLTPLQVRTRAAALFNTQEYQPEEPVYLTPDQVVIVELNRAASTVP